MANPITELQLTNASTDADNLAAVVNGIFGAPDVINRLGAAIPVLANILSGMFKPYQTLAAAQADPLTKFGMQIRVINDGANNGVYVNKVGTVGNYTLDTDFYSRIVSAVSSLASRAFQAVATYADREAIPVNQRAYGLTVRVVNAGTDSAGNTYFRDFVWLHNAGVDGSNNPVDAWVGQNTQAELLNRALQTGSQDQSTINGLSQALADLTAGLASTSQGIATSQAISQGQIDKLGAIGINGFRATLLSTTSPSQVRFDWELRGSNINEFQYLSYKNWTWRLNKGARHLTTMDWSKTTAMLGFGDSFIDPIRGTGSILTKIAAQLNVPLTTAALISGDSKQVYRSGAAEVFFTVAGNTIPAGGNAVAVTAIGTTPTNGTAPSATNPASLLETFDGDTSTAGNSITGTLGGLHGTLSTTTNGSYAYKFTADAGSQAVALLPGSLFVPDYAFAAPGTEIHIWIGENYFYSPFTSTTPGVPDYVNPQAYLDIDAIVRQYPGYPINIYGQLPDSSFLPGTKQFIGLRNYNAGLKARWPEFYVVDSVGRDPLGTVLAINPANSQDSTDIANGVTPTSLRRNNGGGAIDSLHLDPTLGDTLMANLYMAWRVIRPTPPSVGNAPATIMASGQDGIGGVLSDTAVTYVVADNLGSLQADVNALKLTSQVGGSIFYGTRAAGAAATANGNYFTSNETGTLRRYQRTSTAPNYVDAGAVISKGDVGLDQVADLAPADLPASNAVLALIAGLTTATNANIIAARGQAITVPTIADIGNLTWTAAVPRPATLVTVGQTSITDQKGSAFQYIGVINAQFKNRNYRVQDASGNVWTKITPVIPYADRSLAQGLAVQQARNAAYTFATVSDLPKKRIAGDLVLSDTTFMTLPVAGTRYWPRDTLPISQVPAGTARLYTTGLVVENRRPNLIPYPNFDGAVVGIVGSGGAIPTGSDRATADVLEVISLTTDANGIKTFVYETRRTGGSPVASSSAWRVRALGDPITPSAGMGVAFHAFATVLNATGATAVVFSLQELTSAGVFVATHAYYLRLDGVQDRPVIHAIPATPGNKFIPSITTYPTTTTSDYTVRVAVELMKVEESIEPRDITTWTESGKVTTASPNLVTNTGAALGIVGSGGALPTGWDRSNTSDVVTILQLSPLRIQVARGSGSNATSMSLRPVSYANRVQNTSGAAASYALRAGIKVISATAVDAVATYVQELTSADANVGSTSITLPQDGTANVSTPTRSIANTEKTVPGIGIYYQASANFSIVIEFSELPSFGLAQIAYPATLVEAPVLTGAPTGSFDILQLSANTSVWSLAVALAGSLTLTLPKQRSLQIVKQAILLPAGSSWQQRTDIIDGLNPIAFEPLPISDSIASIGGQMCGVNSAQQPWSMMRASNRDRVMRYEVRSGDHWSQDVTQDGGVTHRERCELKIGTAFFTYDVDQWIAWSFMLLPGAPVVEVPVQGDYCSLGQTHDGTITNEKNYSNMLGTGMWQDDRWGIFANTNPDSTTTTNYQTVINYQDSDPTPRGVWQHMVARIRPSLANTGRVQIYKNAAVGSLPVIDYTGPLGFSGSPGWYWKEGIYRGERTATLAVLFANLEFGSDLSALIGNPRDIA